MLRHTSDSYAGQEPGRDGFPGPIAQIKVGQALYDLATDIGQTRDVAPDHPDVATVLQALAETERTELGDALTGRTGRGVHEPGRLVPAGSRAIAHAGVGCVIQLADPPSPKYPGHGGPTLLDGERGSFDFHDGKWLGFEGSDFKAAVDLGGPGTVRRVACGFLEEQASWIFLLVRVDVAVSADRATYKPARMFVEKAVARRGPRVRDYAASIPRAPVRFVRVRAESIWTCPSWHIGASGKARLFVDGIMIG
jgi:hypothetical protein